MEKDYSKFLQTKLYLIEHYTLQGKMRQDPLLSKIYDICIGNYSYIMSEVDSLTIKEE